MARTRDHFDGSVEAAALEQFHIHPVSITGEPGQIGRGLGALIGENGWSPLWHLGAQVAPGLESEGMVEGLLDEGGTVVHQFPDHERGLGEIPAAVDVDEELGLRRGETGDRDDGQVEPEIA